MSPVFFIVADITYIFQTQYLPFVCRSQVAVSAAYIQKAALSCNFFNNTIN